MRWLDSRIESPSSNAFDAYFVVFHHKGCEDILMRGFADWRPDPEYKTGSWGNVRCTNGNKQDGATVLYWMQHPTFDYFKSG